MSQQSARLERAFERLRRVQDRLLREGVSFESLRPDAAGPSVAKPGATPLVALGQRIVAGVADAPVAEALVEGLSDLVSTVQHNFPENIFWDFDLLTGEVIRGALAADDPRAWADETMALHVALQELFGHRTSIRFRYVHDFLFGYDWAKWVKKAPEDRCQVGPFDPIFLRALFERGKELLLLIQKNDPTYPTLPGRDHRNPFGFSREPAAERELHRSLARDGLIPAPGWRTAWSFDYRPDYSALRVERAKELGLDLASAADEEGGGP